MEWRESDLSTWSSQTMIKIMSWLRLCTGNGMIWSGLQMINRVRTKWSVRADYSSLGSWHYLPRSLQYMCREACVSLVVYIERKWLVITLILMPLCFHRTVLYLCTVLCFCLKYDSVCIYEYARFCFMYSTRILRKHAKLLSFSCTCLLCRVACSLGMIAYILLYMHRLPTSSGSAVTHPARLPKGHHAEVNFDTFFFSSDVVVSLVLSSCRVPAHILIVSVLWFLCTRVVMFDLSPSCSLAGVFVPHAKGCFLL